MNELMRELDEFVKNRMPKGVMPVKVTAVNEADGTCDGEDVEGNEIFDIRMRASIDGEENGIMMIPAVDSWVLVGNLDNSPNAWAAIMYSELQKYSVRISPMEWRMDDEGLLLKKNADTLAAVMADLIDQIKLLTVTCATPGAPSTVPLNVAAFEAIKNRINQLLKTA